MVRRIADEIAGYVIELGTDGRLLSLQLEEFVAGTAEGQRLVVRDYMPTAGRRVKSPDPHLAALAALDSANLLDLSRVAAALGLGEDVEALDTPARPRGYRVLARLPRLPEAVIEKLISHFGSLQKVLAASAEELRDVEGVGESRARSIREGLSRIAENSLLERFA
jgi:diadenylate cyclase